MSRPFHILHLEDNPDDVELIRARFASEKISVDLVPVDTRKDYTSMLESRSFDLILADYGLPSFDGMAALEIAQDTCPDTPFIFISGTLGEELAIEGLKKGATDYLIKGNLTRLVPAVNRAIREVRERARRREAEREKVRLASFPEENPNPLIEIDRGGAITYQNSAANKMFPDLKNSGSRHPVFEGVLEAVDSGERQGRKLEVRQFRIGNQFFEQHISTTLDGQRVRIYVSDVTERRMAENMVEHQAYHDGLTNLPNRKLFMDRVNQLIARAPWRKRIVAVLFMDLDYFKRINDTLGHRMGDLVLMAVGQRLSESVRDGDSVSRFGGDEFTIVLGDIAKDHDIPRIVQKILALFSKPFVLEGHELFVTASIGISMFPVDGEDAETLLKHADVAMYRAKEQGRNKYEHFSPSMNVRSLERLMLETHLRHALEREELFLQYQPQVDLNGGEIIGMEALVRWRHPEMGLISPGQFIPLAEETGLIIPIGEWILGSACRQAKQWKTANGDPVRTSVNLSARQIQDEEFVEKVRVAIREAGVDPRLLELELTESIMQNAEKAMGVLGELSQLGISVSIDDFGTGYSSLSYLKRFPIQKLKIDQSFVRDIPSDPDNTAIVEAIVSLSHSLKLKVIAEGVETVEQLEWLRSHGCDEVQGYLFSRPLDVGKAMDLLSKSKGLGQS